MARVRSRSWQVLSARGLLACLWLPFALGAHTLQTCTLLDNLDWDHVLVVANLPLPGSGLSPLVSSSSPSAIKQNYKKRDRGAYFSTSGFRSRPGAEASSRKLLFFFLSGLGRGQTSQGISYEYSGTSSPPEPPDRSHSVDTTLSWGLQKPEGVENCWCPPKSREELERTLIRYCGGYEGKMCIEWDCSHTGGRRRASILKNLCVLRQ